ncbi:deoxynucleoside kinase [Kingella potus]|uniref:deoxynucleoside kinase n=1 Tax=Kingella potus TaxID=265175 RepID=UPI001FD474AE|nr:deoxynucleoside kinase [Kingella potus]UOO99919.1 deoxynucleoside kinase [Kingella potus]
MDYRYIVVEGSIGSGKSELARRLAAYFDALYLTESPETNPFLELFYQNAANHGLAAELHFLLRRAKAIEIINAEEAKNGRVVADFLLEKDKIFVPVVLDDNENANEQTLFWETKHKIMPEMPVPDLVIYLQTGDTAAGKRPRTHGGGAPHLFPEGYLYRINEEYRRFFHLYDNAPLLIANNDEMDFTDNDDHFELLLRTISHMQGNRHYLNLKDI